MAIDDRKQLTAEEAYELVNKHVRNFWPEYKSTLGRMMDVEDCVQDVMMKFVTIKDNPNFNPNWKPGDPATIKVTKGENGKTRTEDTTYMLADDYDPEDPYDSLYHLMGQRTFTYLDKYNGRTTSKSYYVMSITKNTMIDFTRKKDIMMHADSLDREIDGDGDSHTTVGDMVADDSQPSIDDRIVKDEIRRILYKLINMLPNQDFADKSSQKGNRGAVGWSPLTGQIGSNGEHIESMFTLRDAAVHLANGYTAEQVASFYHKPDGTPISVGTVRTKFAEVVKRLKELKSQLTDEEKEFLSSVYF